MVTKRSLTILLIVFVMTFVAAAQDDDDVQSWNDLQLTVPIAKPVDVFMKATFRFGKNVTRLSDQRFAFGFVWKPTKALSISPYYWYVNARNVLGNFATENRLAIAATYRFKTGKKFGLWHRSTYEYRMRFPINTHRYRALLTFEKDLPERIMKNTKWFVADEVFYDSFTNRFSRNRFGFGISKTINKKLTWDLYYTRQNDGFAHPGDLHIVWQAWKIKF